MAIDRRPVRGGRRTARAARPAPAPVPGPPRGPTAGPRRLRPHRPPAPSSRPGASCAGCTDEADGPGRRRPAAGPGGRPARATRSTRSTRAAIEDADEDGRLEAEEDRLAAAAAHRARRPPRPWPHCRGAGDGSALDRLAEASGALAGRAPLAGLERRVRSAMAELSDLATELRSVVETWEDDPERLEEIRARRQLLHELAAQVRGRPGARCWPSPPTPGPRLAAIERRGAAGRGPRRGDRRGPGRAGRRPRPRWPRPGGRPLPGWPPQIEATLRELAMPSARFTDRRRGDGAGRPGDASCSGPTPASRCSRWPRRPRGASWPAPCWPSGWPSPTPPGCMVFDEVDAGVGGCGGHRGRGRPWPSSGDHAQVLVVTHLAQVAAQADQQIEVRKSERVGRTRSEVDRPRRRRPGGRAQPDAVGQPGQRRRPGATPASCSDASAGPVGAGGDRAPAPDAGVRTVHRAGSASLVRCPTWMARRNPSGIRRPVHPDRRAGPRARADGPTQGPPSSSSSPAACPPRWARASPPRRSVACSSAAASGSPCASSTRTSTSTRAR